MHGAPFTRRKAFVCACAANLLRRASVLPPEAQPRTSAGRRWLRAYLNGCAFKVFDAPLPDHLAGLPFCELVEWLYRSSNFVLIGARPQQAQQILLSHSLFDSQRYVWMDGWMEIVSMLCQQPHVVRQ